MAELKQYKCLTDLKQIMSELGDYRARPSIKGSHPTLYKERANGKYRTVMGIRICDYKFTVDEKEVLPDHQMGLSFSSTWENLKFVHGMFSNKGKRSVDIYWVLSEADIPPGLKFVEEEGKPGHYFLTVTERMRVEKLVEKLKLVSYRLSVIKDGGRAL